MYETDDNEFPFKDDVLEPSPARLDLFCYETRRSVERATVKSRLLPSFFEHFSQQLPANETHLSSEVLRP